MPCAARAGSTACPGTPAHRRGRAAGDPPQVAHRAQTQAVGGCRGDHHAVLVLSQGRSRDLDMPPGKRVGQRGPDRRRIRHRDARTGLKAGQRGPEVFGNHVHQALFQRRLDELPRTQAEPEPDGDPGVLHGQPIDRRQQLAFREVERGHDHRAATRAGAARRHGAALARGDQRERQRAGDEGGHRPARRSQPGGRRADGHGLTFSAPPTCHSAAGPVTEAPQR